MDIREAAFFVVENFLFEKKEKDDDERSKSERSGKDTEKQISVHQAAVALGSRGGKEGGPARQAQMTDDAREALARKAAKARWGKKVGKPASKPRWKKKTEQQKRAEKEGRKKHKKNRRHRDREKSHNKEKEKNESYMIWEEPGPRAILRDDGHYDTHGLTKAHLDYIASHPEVLAAKGPVTLTMPSHLAPLKNALVGPSSGDSPVGEHQVHYKSRGGGRNYNSRMMRGSPRETRMVTAISVPDQKTGRPFLVTAWGGPLSPKEVDDPSHTPESRAESKKFWSQHALLDG